MEFKFHRQIQVSGSKSGAGLSLKLCWKIQIPTNPDSFMKSQKLKNVNEKWSPGL